jgi:hypothetical protein
MKYPKIPNDIIRANLEKQLKQGGHCGGIFCKDCYFKLFKDANNISCLSDSMSIAENKKFLSEQAQKVLEIEKIRFVKKVIKE